MSDKSKTTKRENPNIIELWEELRVIFEMIDLDVRKNARGNVSAGIRARKGLRTIKKCSSDLIRMTVDEEKKRKLSKEIV